MPTAVYDCNPEERDDVPPCGSCVVCLETLLAERTRRMERLERALHRLRDSALDAHESAARRCDEGTGHYHAFLSVWLGGAIRLAVASLSEPDVVEQLQIAGTR